MCTHTQSVSIIGLYNNQPLNKASKNFNKKYNTIGHWHDTGVAFISSIPADLLWVCGECLYNDIHKYTILEAI